MRPWFARAMSRVVCALLCFYAAHLCANDVRAQNTASHRAPASTRTALPKLAAPIAPPAGVVSVVHRIGGWRLLTLLERDELSLPADAASRFVHTNIVAGYTRDDRRFVVVRLPQGEVEALAGEMPPQVSRESIANSSDPPALTVVDDRRTVRTARFVGLDAGTGLSLLEYTGKLDVDSAATRGFLRAPSPPKIDEIVHLFAPEATERLSDATALRLRIGERQARFAHVSTPGGGFSARLLEPADDGGRSLRGAIVTDGRGRLLGVVGDVADGSARVIASREIDSAVDRLLRRRASVAQPWFGARGQDLAAAAPAELLAHGWTPQAARDLLAMRRGVLLTNVPPHTPAALAGLRAGDIVTAIDGEPVRDAKHFSERLAAAGIGAGVRLTIERADAERKEGVQIVVRLSDSLDARRETDRAARLALIGNSIATLLLPLGLEIVTAPADLRARLKAADGLLVVALRQGGVAAAAGLRPGDIIERANGKPLTATDAGEILRSAPRHEVSFDILRGDQRIQVTLKYPPIPLG